MGAASFFASDINAAQQPVFIQDLISRTQSQLVSQAKTDEGRQVQPLVLSAYDDDSTIIGAHRSHSSHSSHRSHASHASHASSRTTTSSTSTGYTSSSSSTGVTRTPVQSEETPPPPPPVRKPVTPKPPKEVKIGPFENHWVYVRSGERLFGDVTINDKDKTIEIKTPENAIAVPQDEVLGLRKGTLVALKDYAEQKKLLSPPYGKSIIRMKDGRVFIGEMKADPKNPTQYVIDTEYGNIPVSQDSIYAVDLSVTPDQKTPESQPSTENEYKCRLLMLKDGSKVRAFYKMDKNLCELITCFGKTKISKEEIIGFGDPQALVPVTPTQKEPKEIETALEANNGKKVTLTLADGSILNGTLRSSTKTYFCVSKESKSVTIPEKIYQLHSSLGFITLRKQDITDISSEE